MEEGVEEDDWRKLVAQQRRIWPQDYKRKVAGIVERWKDFQFQFHVYDETIPWYWVICSFAWEIKDKLLQFKTCYEL